MRLLILLLLPFGLLAAPPNIVLIVSDDQGYRDLGCFGSKEILTPQLDRLAKEGMKLTQFYVTWPACTPSRGSLLTGRYPQRNGIYDMIRNEAPDYGYEYKPGEYEATFERIGGMDTREVLLPELLKPAGYVSGIFGKWDLGVHKRFLPLARGFDDFLWIREYQHRLLHSRTLRRAVDVSEQHAHHGRQGHLLHRPV
ncbi:MAG: sulfatase-like hydrolase/transferase [Limisphaerales bacterium]